MYLKRIELVGFKSFAGKTVLSFPAGITGVVGPNGSGKSNIIDAIRWILGEREARNMRSLRAEDLIFTGTPERPRVGLAQATIVFDNVAKFFPVDYSEVAVKRRIERDGTSKYFLNDAEVRLKDIVDFFAKSRLGTKGFTVINQGDADLFVRATPKERRVMLEEILGLRQYQLKKHDAELKLGTTKINIDKVRALIGELMPHLKLLRRQAAKWEKQADIAEELVKIETQYFGAKFRAIKTDEAKLEPRFRDVERKIAAGRSELVELQKTLRAVEHSADSRKKVDFRLERLRKEKQEFAARRSAFEREIGKLEAQLELAVRETDISADSREFVRLLEETRETIEDALLESDISVIKKLLHSLDERISAVFESDEAGTVRTVREDDVTARRKKIDEELCELDKNIRETEALEAQLTTDLAGFTGQFKEAFIAVEKEQNKISLLERERDQLAFERERISLRREELMRQASQFGKKLEEFSNTKLDRSLNVAEAERRMLRLQSELSLIGEIDPALITEAKEVEARYEFLTSQLADLESAHGNLIKLLRELEVKIANGFTVALRDINSGFSHYFRMMFGGGKARLALQRPIQSMETAASEYEIEAGVSKFGEGDAGLDISVSVPSKRISSLSMLSGGEKSLVSLAVLFALIAVSPPPFLVLDEADAALDETNSIRFSNLVKEFSKKTQFVLVTHNRTTMEAADVLYGVTMGEDGTSRVLSLKLA